MARTVTLVDYGMGNLYSVRRAFESLGALVELTDRPADILRASCLVLPGVGAFKDGMAELQARGLVAPFRAYVESGRPALGICLGMQMLLEESEEFGRYEGLGLIAGSVKAIPKTGADGKPHKVPHIGWNDLRAPEGVSWQGTLLEGIPQGTEVYFVHSYTAHPADASVRLADVNYGGRRLSALVRKERLYGCQFHPEKSGPAGLAMLRNFLELGSAG